MEDVDLFRRLEPSRRRATTEYPGYQRQRPYSHGLYRQPLCYLL